MGIVIKQSGISTVFTYTGTLIGFINTVILFPAFLSSEQIGLLRAIPSAAFMLMPLAQMGLARAMIKFFPEFKKLPDGLEQFTWYVLIRVLIGGLITGGLIWVFRDPINQMFADNAPLFNEYIYVVIILVMILAFYTLMETYSRIFLKIVVVNIIREVMLRLLMSLGVALYFIGWISFHQLTIGLIIIFSATLIAVVGYLKFQGHLRISLKQNNINPDLKKRITDYAIYGLIGASGGYVILNVDQVMVTAMIGLDANGIYTTAFFFAVMIELSRRAITQITTPLVADYFESKNMEAIKSTYKKVSINQMAIGLLFFLGITSNMTNIYNLMPNGSDYEVGYWVVFIIGISKLIDMSFGNNGEIITMSEYYRFNVLTMAILAGLMVLLNYLLIPVFDINGAALATVLSVSVFNLVKMGFIKWKLGFIPFSWNSIKLLIIAVIAFLLAFLFPPFENPVFDLLIRSIVIVTFYLPAIYFFKISDEINSIANKTFKILK